MTEGSRPQAGAGKATWRAWARTVRSSLDPVAGGLAVCAALRAWPEYRGATRILTYLAFGDEYDLAPLHGDHGKEFLVTRTDSATGLLTVHRLDPGSLELHRYGFLQPSPLSAVAGRAEIEMVLVPGLAFDMTGHRLGYGKGYYDRFLSRLDPGIPRVGIVPGALLVPELPAEAHDVPVTHLASESGVFAAGAFRDS